MSKELTVQQNKELAFANSFKQLLSGVSEAEFVQMLMPTVRMLPAESVSYILDNCTSDEAAEVIGRITDIDVLNQVAVSTDDSIIAGECAKRQELSLVSLNWLMDKFVSPVHIWLYSKHTNADSLFLERIFKFVESKRGKRSVFKYENDILEAIASNNNCSDTVLLEIGEYIEGLIGEVEKVNETLEDRQKVWDSKHKWGGWRSSGEYERLEKRLEKVQEKATDYFKVLLAVAGNANTPSDYLETLFRKYGSKSVHTLCDNSCSSMLLFMGVTNAESVGYKVLTNPSIDKRFRSKHLKAMTKENRGIYQSGGSGEEYLQRIKNAKDPEAIKALHKLWVAEETKDEMFNFSHTPLRKYAGAIGRNMYAPSSVIDDITLRICEKYPHYEYMQVIVGHPNLTRKSSMALVVTLSGIEGKDPDYMDACMETVVVPLAGNKALHPSACRVLYDLLITMKKRGYEALAALAGNPNAKKLDAEFATHKSAFIRLKYAERADDLLCLAKLCEDKTRDVSVAARRRYAELTKTSAMLDGFEDAVIRLEGNA